MTVKRTIGRLLLMLAVTTPVVGCKVRGSCIMEGTADWEVNDECWVWHEEANCKGEHRTFVRQDSREKSETYCYMEGFKDTSGKTPVYTTYRPRKKK